MRVPRFWRRGVRPQAYQRGIMRRYQREAEGWRRHLEQTRANLLHFAADAGAEELSILGSGWLLDVPIEELLAHGCTLHLYDVSHPPQVLARYGAFERIRFHTADLTGGLLSLLDRCGSKRTLLDRMRGGTVYPPVGLLPSARPVVSLNLLSQLGYPLLDLHWLRLSEEEYGWLLRTLQSAHLAWLADFSSALVVSDVREQHYALHDGQFLGAVPTVIADLPELADCQSWSWDFDTSGSYLRDCRVVLEVVSGQLIRMSETY